METKMIAARLATAAGVCVVITSSSQTGLTEYVVALLTASNLQSVQMGTVFVPSANPLRNHQNYYAFVQHYARDLSSETID
jgi:glutamate 5-kinase